jgi:hypothetical protein
MGFIREQEERMAARFLSWQYQKLNVTPPAPDRLAKQAARIVEEAHQIARQRGRNVLSIIKEMVAGIKKS